LIKPWGVSPGKALANPMGEGRVSVRSMLKLLNFKANHRKLAVTDKSLLVTSGNPHDASSAHCNVALRVDGAGMWMGNEAEAAILRISDAEELIAERGGSGELDPETGYRLELLTERKIKEKALEMLEEAAVPGRIELSMFYLSDRDVVRALLDAKKRGCDVRVILDPSKDAFGRTKSGVPNRQTAARLVKKGISLRWAATHGEQFHVKMLYVELPGDLATLLLGSGNFTRRNLDNFNAECDLALTAPLEHEAMARARDTFARWWSNPDGQIHTVEYAVYEDRSLWRRFKAWMMETTGLSSF
jgi:sugar-specific transcriptional regulator TrmB